MGYKIVQRRRPIIDLMQKELFESDVKKEIASGWTPSGGVSVTYNQGTDDYTIMQAMVKS